MAEETNEIQGRPPTFRAALMNMNPKIALAFFLVVVSAFMVIIWMFKTLGPTIDAGMAALLASFVTMFIKMAADASGYQYTSSAGDAKKDETQATVSKALADKVPGAVPAAPVAVVAWWSLLTDTEKAAITEAAKTDAKIQALIAIFAAGKAEPDDLAALVTAGLLTKERAETFKTA